MTMNKFAQVVAKVHRLPEALHPRAVSFVFNSMVRRFRRASLEQSNASIILYITCIDDGYLKQHPCVVAHLRFLFAKPTSTPKISAICDLVQVKFAGTAGLSIDKIGPQIAVVSLKNKRHVSNL
jgi:hypothetical protein